MSSLIPTAAAAVPLVAGWSVHAAWLARRLERARVDPLTGLPGRAALESRGRRMLARGACVVLLVDLDGFKALNDRFGHAAGDAVLAAAGARLRRALPGGLVVRLGGDEFAAVWPAPRALPLALEQLQTWLCAPIDIEGRPVKVGVSVGAAGSFEHGTDLPRLLRAADEAMYGAKRAGGGWCIAAGAWGPEPAVAGRRPGRPGTTGTSRHAPRGWGEVA